MHQSKINNNIQVVHAVKRDLLEVMGDVKMSEVCFPLFIGIQRVPQQGRSLGGESRSRGNLALNAPQDRRSLVIEHL